MLEWLPFIGSGISALGNYFGGRENREQQNQINLMQLQQAQANNAIQQNQFNSAATTQANQWAESFAAGRSDQLFGQGLNQQQFDFQKELAQNGIAMRVADAQRAGIAPLAALGNPGFGFSPVSVGGGNYPSPGGPSPGGLSSASLSADQSMGNSMASIGQDISRAINATRSQEDRQQVVNAATTVLGVQREELQNELLRAQINKLKTENNPPMPSPSDRWLIPGQSGGGVKVENEAKRQWADPNETSREGLAISDITHARNAAGNYNVMPSKDAKERIEDSAPYEWSHFLRNAIMPSLSTKWFKPPSVPLRQGHGWAYNPFTQEYSQVKTRFQERWDGWERR